MAAVRVVCTFQRKFAVQLFPESLVSFGLGGTFCILSTYALFTAYVLMAAAFQAKAVAATLGLSVSVAA